MVIRPKLNESALKAYVVNVARTYRWLIHHDLPAMNRRGRWATHVQGDAGFPDLVLVHHVGDLLVVELKSETGKLTIGQRLFLGAFERAGVETAIWRPADIDNGAIINRLANPSKR